MQEALSLQTKPSRKRCVRTVDLRFFCDDATGEWGLTHKETMESRNGTDGFNAFWDAQGLFHDIWEHEHEFTNKYFKNEYAMNVGGEMAAMGALWYYYSKLGLNVRLNSSYHSPGSMMRMTTESICTEAVSEGYCNFGDILLSNVPRQKSCDDYELEYQTEELVERVKNYKRRSYFDGPQSSAIKEEQDRERIYGEAYRRSVTLSKVKNLHRWGYHMAEKLVPRCGDNLDTLINFYEFFTTFCKDNKAEDLAQSCKGIEVKIYRDGNGIISWKAYLIPKYGCKVSKILLFKHFCEDDMYDLFE